MPEPVRREYVILHHVQADGHHWDLMLDMGEALATWQLASDPAGLAPSDSREAIPARRIGDHRRDYLSYEGPVSRGRGNVTRVDKGAYDLVEQNPAGWIVRLEGALLKGQFHIASAGETGESVFRRAGS